MERPASLALEFSIALLPFARTCRYKTFFGAVIGARPGASFGALGKILRKLDVPTVPDIFSILLSGHMNDEPFLGAVRRRRRLSFLYAERRRPTVRGHRQVWRANAPARSFENTARHHRLMSLCGIPPGAAGQSRGAVGGGRKAVLNRAPAPYPIELERLP